MPGVENYVFDGLDGSQMIFWTCNEAAKSTAHKHDRSKYMLVVEGCYTLIMGEGHISLRAGDEYFIPQETWHAGEVTAGIRTIHAFGGKRVIRSEPFWRLRTKP